MVKFSNLTLTVNERLPKMHARLIYCLKNLIQMKLYKLMHQAMDDNGIQDFRYLIIFCVEIPNERTGKRGN